MAWIARRVEVATKAKTILILAFEVGGRELKKYAITERLIKRGAWVVSDSVLPSGFTSKLMIIEAPKRTRASRSLELLWGRV
jgi:hypothetical protein